MFTIKTLITTLLFLQTNYQLPIKKLKTSYVLAEHFQAMILKLYKAIGNG